MPRAISYCRYSAERQRLGDSLRRQVAKTRDYCERNGLVLDESFRLADLGVSGFRGKNVSTGALGAFLEAVRSGKVERGTLLIVESIDRLGRQELPQAMTLFLEIIGAGISIVTLDPERVHTPQTIQRIEGLIEPLVIMSRANEESQVKSTRIGASWEQRRKAVRDGTGNLGKFRPWWLDYRDNAYHAIPERVEIVRTIFRMKVEGHGVPSIVKRLNAGTVMPRSAKRWGRSTVGLILRSRTVLGEFQTGRIVDGKEVDEGEPIKGYYPAVIEESTFLQAQTGGKRRGRLAVSAPLNVFQGLLFHQDGHSAHYLTNCQNYKGKKLVYRYYASSGHLGGVKGSTPDRIKAETFELAFFKFVKELDPRDFVKGESTVASQIVEVAGAIAGLEATIAATKERIKTAKVKEAALTFLMELDAERLGFVKQLEGLKAKQNTNDVETIGEIGTLAEMLATGDDADLRTRIRGRIRQLVERIDISTSIGTTRGRGNKATYTVGVVVRFLDGSVRVFTCDHDGKLIAGVHVGASESPTRGDAPIATEHAIGLYNAVAEGRVWSAYPTEEEKERDRIASLTPGIHIKHE